MKDKIKKKAKGFTQIQDEMAQAMTLLFQAEKKTGIAAEILAERLSAAIGYVRQEYFQEKYGSDKNE